MTAWLRAGAWARVASVRCAECRVQWEGKTIRVVRFTTADNLVGEWVFDRPEVGHCCAAGTVFEPFTSLSVLVVTSGRETLTRTLESIAAQGLEDQDEVLVVGHGRDVAGPAAAFGYRHVEDGPFGCWGQRERQNAMSRARGTHLLFMDDDDYYLEGAFQVVRRAIKKAPTSPHMFRMIEPGGMTLWIAPAVRCGNVSGTQFVVPSDQRLGVWGLRREGDFDFIESTLKNYAKTGDSLKWHDAVIAGCRTQGKPAARLSKAPS